MTSTRGGPGRAIGRIVAALAALGALLLTGVSPAGATGTGRAVGSAAPPTAPRRVLIVSVPRLTWAQVVAERPRAILSLLDRSAVASMSLRTVGSRTSLGEGYASIGAGNRAGVNDLQFGNALDPQERYEDGTAAATYLRRTGWKPDGAALQVDIASVIATNSKLLYGTVPGALGSALARQRWQRAVVGNGDFGVEGVPAIADVMAGGAFDLSGGEPAPGADAPNGEEADPGSDEPATPTTAVASSVNRALALALMDRRGVVPEGDVRRDLLRRDARSPFGVRTDGDVLVRQFRDVWRDRAAVMVEMSDLERADRYAASATPRQGAVMRREAIDRIDGLVAEVLAGVDFRRDLVLFVSPAAPRSHEEATPFAMSGPGVSPGLTQSGTTRRAGYVTLPDVAPTILDRLSIEPPTAMSGTIIGRTGHGDTGLSAYRRFVAKNQVTAFRDEVAGPVSVWFLVFSLLGYGFALLSLTGRRQRLRPWSAFVALMILAFPTVTFLFGLVRADHLGFAGFLAAVFAVSALLAAGAQQAGFRLVRRGDPRAAMVPPLLLIGAMYALQVIDVMTGSTMQIDTVFGYSPVVAGRFSGFGNLSFALLAMSTVVLSTGVWGLARIKDQAMEGGRSHVGISTVIALFLVAIVADGYPAFGSDVGGVLALVPAGAVVVILLSGRRFDLRRLLLIAAATVGALATFAAIDLARPPEDRTHLGRLVARTFGSGGSGLGTVLSRKLAANLHVLTSSAFIWFIPAALVFLVFLTWRRSGFVRSLMDVIPGSRACLWGGIVVAVLGFALNDSGMAIPAMMFPVLLPYLIHLLVQPDSGPDAQAPKWLEALLARFERDERVDGDGEGPAASAGAGTAAGATAGTATGRAPSDR